MAMETGGSIGFPIGDTYVDFYILELNSKKKNIFRIQPTTGKKFLWIVLGITLVLILVAILFPTVIMVTRTDDSQSTGTIFTITNLRSIEKFCIFLAIEK